MAYAYTIYLVTCSATGKVYVGQTTQPLEKRWAHHRHMAKSGKSNGCSALHSAMRKYGEDQFSIVTLGAFASREELNAAEVKEIAARGSVSPGGYNLKAGGRASAHSEKTKAKMHAARKGNGRIGTRHTAETKAKMRASALGRDVTPMLKAAHTPETRKRIAWGLREHFYG